MTKSISHWGSGGSGARATVGVAVGVAVGASLST